MFSAFMTGLLLGTTSDTLDRRVPAQAGTSHLRRGEEARRTVTFERELEVEQLESRLGDDPRGIALKELVERLAAGKARALGELNRGVTAEEHERLALLLRAFDAGIDALPRLWEHLNSRG